MEGYLLQGVERILMSELQARGYAPHASDVKPAAAKIIALVEDDLKAKAAKAEAEEAEEVEVIPEPAKLPTHPPVAPVAPVVPQAPVASQAISQTQLPQKS